jgi:signal transduction histidine kinase
LTRFVPCRKRVCRRRFDRWNLKAATLGSLSSALFLSLCILLSGCRSQQGAHGPSIEFTKVPLAGEGGPDKLDTIEGRVVQARPGQQIVLFARWGPWWVQPLADQPFTRIQADSKWRNSTHFGTEYAALLVDPGYRPQATMDVLPSEGPGVIVVAITKGRPVFWQTWWFALSGAVAFALAVVMFFRLRMLQFTKQMNMRFEERLAERTRIAQELHDTLLQGFLSASMQLHVADDHLAVDSPAKPLVGRVLELMGHVIEEGRNAVRGLRSSKLRSPNLEQAFSQIRQEFPVQPQIGFRIIVEGTPRPLRPVIRDEVYLIGHEALSNAFRHAHASDIEVELEYEGSHLRVLVRDNGDGIDTQVLRSGRDGHWGLSGMKERSERIGGKLRVLSRAVAGTEVELFVPGKIAFEFRPDDHPARWLSRLYRAKRRNEKSRSGSEQPR